MDGSDTATDVSVDLPPKFIVVVPCAAIAYRAKMPDALFTWKREALTSSTVIVGSTNPSRLRSLPEFKVFRPVVIALSVDVMDILFGF
jgi:hypothetical protein